MVPEVRTETPSRYPGLVWPLQADGTRAVVVFITKEGAAGVSAAVGPPGQEFARQWTVTLPDCKSAALAQLAARLVLACVGRGELDVPLEAVAAALKVEVH